MNNISSSSVPRYSWFVMNCFWWTIDECSRMFMNIHQRSSLDELHLTGSRGGQWTLVLLSAWRASTSCNWNESGFRPPLCTYRLNWARRTSWGWWDDWDDTVLQTQDSKFEPWRSEAEHATSRSRRLPTILTFTRGWGRNIYVSFKPPRPGTEPRTLAWKAAVLTTTLGPPPSTSCKWPSCNDEKIRDKSSKSLLCNNEWYLQMKKYDKGLLVNHYYMDTMGYRHTVCGSYAQ